jgi:hypothetical protein
LINEDLPTFDRPMNANSGNRAGGQDLYSVLLVMKRADSWAMVRAKVRKKGRSPEGVSPEGSSPKSGGG